MSLSQTISSLQSLLDEHAVAKLIGMSVASLRRWRLLKRAPKFLRVGARVKYRPEDLQAWLESRPFGGSNVQESPANSLSNGLGAKSVGRRRTDNA
jgi:predicted DNA-binding transcriptional regulator AlpA